MEVYMDDMLVKSKEELDHLDDLKEMFATLKQYQIKLNPGKCVLGWLQANSWGSWCLRGG